MKKLILITGVIVYSLFAVAMIIDSSAGKSSFDTVMYETYSTESAPKSEPSKLYVVKVSDGKVAVADGATGKIIKKTDTTVSILPKGDQKMLKKGIAVSDEKQLRLLLEDYCS